MKLENFVSTSISGDLSLEEQKRFLAELNEKGFSGADIATMVTLFYKQMPENLDLPGAIDLCGTGGSGLSRINTSTLSTFVLAACGVPVAKHGNKAASGRFGSFDLLEAMGINIMADKGRLEGLYQELDLAFIFARSFHPVFKHFAQVRQELKVKTIFNILGPLLNPASPEFQIIGTSNPSDMQLMAEAARAIGKKKVLVVNGSDGLDELTLTGTTSVLELKDGEIKSYTLKPEDFGFSPVAFEQIAGGDREFNLSMAQRILHGSCTSQHLNLVLANTALALKFMGKAETYQQGVAIAREAINSGATKRLLTRYSQRSNTPDILLKITDYKRKEIEQQKKDLPLDKIKEGLKNSERNFKSASSKPAPLNLIAEIKKSSPSEQEIYKGDFRPGEIAAVYEGSGADAISVLTDQKFFGGALENLELARSATADTPLLMKDFIIDEYQIYLGRYYGADAVLLIVAILTLEQIQQYAEIARSLNMDVLVEAHDLRELQIALQSNTDIIGINNRDLHVFETDTKTFMKLVQHIPRSKVIVAESGYSAANAATLHGVANAVLVGSAIMKSKDMSAEITRIKTNKKKFKACGIRTVEAARYCEERGVEYVGINFVPSSKRRVDVETGKALVAVLRNSFSVGIFMDQALEEVNQIAEAVGLDYVQLSGSECPGYCQQINLPVIKTISVNDIDKLTEYRDAAFMFIVDGTKPGSGQGYDYSKLVQIDTGIPFLVAGGIGVDNVAKIFSVLPKASGIDAATGIETDGQVDPDKIDSIASLVARY